MSSFYKNIRTIPTTHGLSLFALLTVYFLLMRFIGFGHVYWLRALNILILFFIIRSSLITYRHRSTASYYDDFMDYFRIGARTSFIGAGLFALFIAIYLDQFDRAFFEEMKTVENLSPYLSPVSAAVLVFIEGMVSGLACSFVLIQFYKRKTVEHPTDDTISIKKEADLSNK